MIVKSLLHSTSVTAAVDVMAVESGSQSVNLKVEEDVASKVDITALSKLLASLITPIWPFIHFRRPLYSSSARRKAQKVWDRECFPVTNLQ